MLTPPDNTPGLYLCRVSGFKHCEYMVLNYDGEFWFRYYTYYYPPYNSSTREEGWCGMDEGIEIKEIVQLIKAD